MLVILISIKEFIYITRLQQGFMQLHAIIFLETVVWSKNMMYHYDYISTIGNFEILKMGMLVILMICGISITLPILKSFFCSCHIIAGMDDCAFMIPVEVAMHERLSTFHNQFNHTAMLSDCALILFWIITMPHI
ncbi:hypothetical protein ACJX0J_040127 [Zea mays]